MDSSLRELERRLRAAPFDAELAARVWAARSRMAQPPGWPPRAPVTFGEWLVFREEDLVADPESGHGRAEAWHARHRVGARLELRRAELDPVLQEAAIGTARLAWGGDPDLASLWGLEGEVEWGLDVFEEGEGSLLRGTGGERWEPRAAVALTLELARTLTVLRRAGVVFAYRRARADHLVRAPSGKVGLLFDLPAYRPAHLVRERWPGRRLAPPLLNPVVSPPEELSGRLSELDEDACGVYSLGAVLYDLLSTHHPVSPYQTTLELHSLLTEHPAPPLLGWCPDLDPALAAFVDSCLVRDPRRRWPCSPAEVACQLERWLAGQPVRPPHALARLWRRVRGG